MAGRDHLPAEVRLASGRALWRLNALGRLRVVDEEGEPLKAAELKALIADDLDARGLSKYPPAGEHLPPRKWPPQRRSVPTSVPDEPETA